MNEMRMKVSRSTRLSRAALVIALLAVVVLATFPAWRDAGVGHFLAVPRRRSGNGVLLLRLPALQLGPGADRAPGQRGCGGEPGDRCAAHQADRLRRRRVRDRARGRALLPRQPAHLAG